MCSPRSSLALPLGLVRYDLLLPGIARARVCSPSISLVFAVLYLCFCDVLQHGHLIIQPQLVETSLILLFTWDCRTCPPAGGASCPWQTCRSVSGLGCRPLCPRQLPPMLKGSRILILGFPALMFLAVGRSHPQRSAGALHVAVALLGCVRSIARCRFAGSQSPDVPNHRPGLKQTWRWGS